jgi:hypothetical protein
MCLASNVVSELKVSLNTLKVKLKDGLVIPITLTDKVNNLIPQMWGRLHDCEHFPSESHDALAKKIQACYDILVSNLIGVYLDIDEFFVTDIYPVYYEESGNIRYAVWYHNDEHISGVEIDNLNFDEVKEKIHAKLQEGGYFEKY